MSDILADIDAAIEDAEGYIEWHGSEDAAEWHADGSHEPDELHGDYYAYDRGGLMEYAPYTIPYRTSVGWRAALDAAVLMYTTGREFEREWLRPLPDALDSARWFPEPRADLVAETVASWPLEPVSDRPFVAVLRELQSARTEVEPSW